LRKCIVKGSPSGYGGGVVDHVIDPKINLLQQINLFSFVVFLEIVLQNRNLKIIVKIAELL